MIPVTLFGTKFIIVRQCSVHISGRCRKCILYACMASSVRNARSLDTFRISNLRQNFEVLPRVTPFEDAGLEKIRYLLSRVTAAFPGNAYLALRDYGTAISCFNLALQTQSESAKKDVYLSNRATALFRIGELLLNAHLRNSFGCSMRREEVFR